jgi:L-alanine-DL-glutamate epimerase-like enolase superfamily enzyme
MLWQLTAHSERWQLKRPFRIARGEKTAADVVVAEIRAGGKIGRGECVPYARYGETVESVLAQIEGIARVLGPQFTRTELALLPPGAARNAVDCAIWDLEAQLAGKSVAQLIGAPEPENLVTAVTISLDAPAKMAEAAKALAGVPLLKVKVDGGDPEAAVRAVRAAAPGPRLIVDPNESWTAAQLRALLPCLAALNVALLEQPVPAETDGELEGLTPAVPLCADEAAHTRDDLAHTARRYQAVNIKLDKAGGLTEALAMRDEARRLGLKLMVGCMVSSSLGVAPALQVAHGADFVDLDGPWWLAADREPAMRFENGRLFAPHGGWGYPRGDECQRDKPLTSIPRTRG